VGHEQEDEVHGIEVWNLQKESVAYFVEKLGAKGSVLERSAQLGDAFQRLVEVLGIDWDHRVFSILHDLDNQVELVPTLRMLYLVKALQIKHLKLHPESVRIHLLQAAKRLL
jgi:hypothetical protein